jgi:4'-phosphopantetheinyl transferase
MLLFSRYINEKLQFAAWHISEGEAFFRGGLPLSADEISELQQHRNPLRVKEWLASRWLLHQLTGEQVRLPLAKNTYSKPFFVGETGQFCSLSHSQGMVAALLTDKDCGCDIQVIVEKMPRIAPKFMRPDELEWVERKVYSEQFILKHLFWTAKEAMYKAYGQKEVDFKAQLFIEPFEWQTENVVTTKGKLDKNGLMIGYQLYMGIYESMEEGISSFLWTIAVEIDAII